MFHFRLPSWGSGRRSSDAGHDSSENRLARRRRRALERSARKAIDRPLAFERLESRAVFSTGPILVSLQGAAPPGSPINASSLTYTAVFSETVTGVDAADFIVAKTGTAAGTVTQVTPVDGTTYFVTIGGMIGDGTIGLSLVDDGTIHNALGVRLDTAGSSPTFLPQRTFAVGLGPYSVTAADFNGDGRKDLAVADNFASTVSILLGNGDGTFEARQTISVGSGPFSIASVDFDGDGNVDLITTDNNGNSVDVLFGNGNGTFLAPTTLGVGNLPRASDLADLDGDADLDLAVVNSASNTVSILLSNGDGTFMPQQTFAVGSSPRSIRIGDFNGDGNYDLVVANNNGNSVSVLIGNGNGSFQSQQTLATGSLPRALAIADWNSDGFADITVVNAGASSIGVLLGNGNGTFQTQQTFGVGSSPRAIAVGDLDGDGKLDAAIANLTNDSLSVLFGNGNGTFRSQQTFAVGDAPYSVALSDVNGDGRQDLVAANRDDASAGVLLGAASFAGTVYSLDHTIPTVQSIVRTTPATIATNASTVGFTVTFSEAVTNVDAADFTGVVTGSVAWTSLQVTGSGASYVVTLNGVTGDGTLGLGFVGAQNIRDAATNSLVGTVPTGANQAFTIDHTLAAVASIVRSSPTGQYTNGSIVTYTVTFGEAVTGVDVTDFAVDLTGTATGIVSQVTSVSTSVYTVTVGSITGDGTLGLILSDNGTIRDLVGNRLAFAPDSTFTNLQTFAISGLARATAAADLNGDGNVDLIAAIDGLGGPTNTVAYWLGNGNGTFQAQQTLAVDTNPKGITVADLNGDGKLDLLVTGTNGTPQTFLGNGNGTFQAAQFVVLGTSPYSIAPGDFNGDGKLDLAAANRGSTTVSLALGNGNGTFQARQTFNIGSSVKSVVARDFDGDGKLDLAVSDYNSVNIRLGNGNGTFKAQTTFAAATNAFELQSGDMNGDGKFDIVYASSSVGQVGVLLGNGNGTFQAQQTYTAPLGAFSLSLRDFSGDGKADVVFANTYSGSASLNVLLGNGNGTLQPVKSTPIGTARYSVTLADFTGDGRLDLALAGGTSYTFTTLANIGRFVGPTYTIDHTNPIVPTIVRSGASPQLTNATSVSFTVTFSEAMSGIDAADFVVDTTPGLTASANIIVTAVNASTYTVTVNGIAGNGTLGIKFVDGAGNTDLAGNRVVPLQARQTFAVGAKVYSFATGDLNGDGKLDLVSANLIEDSISVLIGNGDGTFQAQQTFAVGASSFSVTLGDVNGDGKLDAVVANNGGAGTISVLFGTGTGSFQAQQTYAIGSGPDSVTLGDLNGDGKLDIGLVMQGAGRAVTLLNNGDGTFQAAQSISLGAQAWSAKFYDLDGDGKLDLVVGNTGSTNVLLGNGNGTFKPRMSITLPTGPNYTTAGDLNSDGKLDLVVVDRGSQAVRTFLGNGNGTFTVGQSYAVGTGAAIATVADLDGDGDLDIALGNRYSSNVAILYGNGNGSFQDRVNLFAGNGAFATLAGDWNGDGRVDLAVSTMWDYEIGIFSGVAAGAVITSPTYTIDQIPPQLVSIVQTSPVDLISNARTLVYRVTFDGPVVGVSLSDFVLVPTGTVVGSITQVTAVSGSIYDVTVDAVGGDGTLTLTLVDDATVRDAAGNRLVTTGTSTTFLPRQSYDFNTGPTGITVADFNNDGKLDLAVALQSADAISIALGNGDGTYKARQTYAVNLTPNYLIGADLNNDGRVDLVTNTSGGSVSVLIGNGDGTFKPNVTYNFYGYAPRFTVADVNDDGKLDLLNTSYNNGKLVTLFGNGNGTFQPYQLTAIGIQPTMVAVSDVDGDGKADLLVANDEFNGTLFSVYLGNGDGTYKPRQTYALGNGPSFIDSGDFNADGKRDFVVTNSDDGTVSVFLADVNGTFRAPQTFFVGDDPDQIAVADIDADGTLDLAVVAFSDRAVQLLYGNGDGTFRSPRSYGIGENPLALAIADLNGDNRLDIITTDNVSETTSTLLNAAQFFGPTLTLDHTIPQLASIIRNSPALVTDSSSVSYTVTFSEDVLGVDATDFNLSISIGFSAGPTIAVTPVSGSAYTVTVAGIVGNGTIGLNLLNDGSIRDAADNHLAPFRLQQTVAATVTPLAVTAVDLNGDGKLDLAMVSSPTNRVGVLLGNGDGTYQALQTFTVGSQPTSLAFGDVNNDGKVDLLIGDSGASSIDLLLGNGNGTFQARQSFATSQWVRDVAMADLNGDGNQDLLALSTLSSVVNVFLGNGNGTFKARQSVTVGSQGVAMSTGDFNGDGKVDLAVANSTNNRINILIGNGNGTFQTAQSKAAGALTGAVAVGDVNGDGKADIVVTNQTDGTVGVFLGNGTGTFKAQTTIAVGASPRGVKIADLDGDGRLDLSVALADDNGVALLFGNGDGTFRAVQTLHVGASPFSVAAADLDGDTQLDLVLANTTDSTLSILRGGATGTFAGPSYTIDQAAPTVSIVRTNPFGAISNAATASYTVVFSEAVTGVDASDFMLRTTGNVVGTISQFTAVTSTVYTFNVTGLSGSGQLGVSLVDDGTVRDVVGRRLDAATASNIAFANPRTFAAGSIPSDLAFGDFNGDGIADLVTSNSSGNSVSLLLGNGDGSFKPQQTWAVGTSPSSIEVGDVDNDGKLDLAVADTISNTVSVLLGNGNGTFQARRSFSAPTNPRSLILRDFNADGNLDAAVASNAVPSLRILYGNGDGTFAAPTTVPGGNSIQYIASADLNNDGRPDLVATTSGTGGLMRIYLANQSGFPTPLSIDLKNVPTKVTFGDVNNDGKVDIIAANSGVNDISVLLGNGDGTFQAERTFAIPAISWNFVLYDFNGDSKLDLVSASGTVQTPLRVLFGNGDGTFGAGQTYAVGSTNVGLVVNDFNGDGRVDLAALSISPATVYILFGGPEFAGQAYTVDRVSPSVVSLERSSAAGPTNASSVSFTLTFDENVTDVDATAFAAVPMGVTSSSLIVTPVSGSVYTITIGGIVGSGTIGLNLIDNGTIRDAADNRLSLFQLQRTIGVGVLPRAVVFADFNGDGRADMAVANQSGGSVGILLGNGDGTFRAQQTYAASVARNLAVGDLNGDGKLDFVVIGANTSFSVRLGNGDGTFQSEQTFAGSDLQDVVLGDVNGDGKLDLAVANLSASAVNVFLGNGNGTFQAASTFATATSPTSIRFGDLNGDGKLDIVAGSAGVSRLSVLMGNGDGTFQLAQTSIISAPDGLALGDVNGDGKLDLAIGSTSSGTASILLGNGNGTFQTGQTQNIGGTPYAAHLVDFDNDGKLDLAVATGGTNLVNVLFGNGNGTFQAPKSFAAGANPNALATTDLNGDGFVDLAVANRSDGTLGILFSGADGTFRSPKYVIDQLAPTITGVYARAVGTGTANWNSTFLAYLAANDMGDASLGYMLSVGGTQLRTLPWTNVNTLSLRFSEEVTIAQGDLAVISSANGPAVPAVTGFAWDSTTHTGTWTFAAALPRGKFLLHLGGTLLDTVGNALDGEWTVSSSTSSGNGTAGGDFNFRFNVLPSDFDGNNGVTITEVLQARNRAGKGTGSVGYAYREDIDGNGNITITEVLASRNRTATSITGLNEPVAPGSTPQSPLELAPLVPGEEEGLFVSPYAALTEAELAPIVAEAIARWEASGLVAANFDWSKLRFAITDLGPAYLGLGNPDGAILLDDDGAGWGWFVDGSPSEDGEFASSTTTDAAAAAHMDLLTVVMHEIGHALGYPTGSAQDTPAAALMSEFLGIGTRRTPGIAAIGQGSGGIAAESDFALSDLLASSGFDSGFVPTLSSRSISGTARSSQDYAIYALSTFTEENRAIIETVDDSAKVRANKTRRAAAV